MKQEFDLDELQAKIGGMSRYQWLVCLAASFYAMVTSPSSQIALYLSAVPSFRCAVPPVDGPAFNLTEEQILNYTTPKNGAQDYDSCSRYDQNLTACENDLSCLNPPTTDTIKCDKGYVYDRSIYDETTVTQWDLVCDRRILDTIANSLFFAGMLIGSGLTGPLSDWFGRKRAMLVLWSVYIVFEVGIAFSPTFELFVFQRVMVALTSVTTMIVSFTYVGEIVPKAYRTRISTLIFTFHSVGHCLVPALAFALRDWHELEFISGLLPLPFILLYPFIPESPRWLLSMDKPDEARKIVAKYARSNGTELNDEEWKAVVETEKQRILEANEMKKYSILDLFKTPRMRLISIVVMYAWFSVNILFYGLTLNAGNLVGDPFVNGLANSSIELVGNWLPLLAPFVGKRNLTCFSFLFAGVFCLVSTVCNELAHGSEEVLTAGVVFAVAGKMLATACFLMMYGVTSDVYPTVARVTGMSLGSMSARFGGILTPWTIELQNIIPWLTQTIFGVLSIIAFIACLFFPETERSVCLMTMDEAETFYIDNMTLYNKLFGKAKKPRDSEEQFGDDNTEKRRNRDTAKNNLVTTMQALPLLQSCNTNTTNERQNTPYFAVAQNCDRESAI